MILAALKIRTRELHRQAELALNLAARLKSLDSYIQLLRRLHGFYAPLEQQLAGAADYSVVGLSWSERRKATLIEQDLKILQSSEFRADLLPRCAKLPRTAGLPSALGCMYVLEGATLGGQIIRREINKHLGLHADSGCAFFNGYGEARTGEMWQRFSAAVSVCSELAPEADAAILAAAAETFVCFEEWVAC